MVLEFYFVFSEFKSDAPERPTRPRSPQVEVSEKVQYAEIMCVEAFPSRAMQLFIENTHWFLQFFVGGNFTIFAEKYIHVDVPSRDSGDDRSLSGKFSCAKFC